MKKILNSYEKNPREYTRYLFKIFLKKKIYKKLYGNNMTLCCAYSITRFIIARADACACACVCVVKEKRSVRIQFYYPYYFNDLPGGFPDGIIT